MPASSGRGQCTETDVGGRVISIGRPCFFVFESMVVIAGFIHYDNGSNGSDTLTSRTTTDSEKEGMTSLRLPQECCLGPAAAMLSTLHAGVPV